MENDADAAMAETLLERLGGALTVDDILLRAAGVWHRIRGDALSSQIWRSVIETTLWGVHTTYAQVLV